MYRIKSGDGIVLITGGSSGIGEGLVNKFRAEKYTVVTISRRPTPDQHAYVGDVTNRDQMREVIDTIIKKYGRIALVIANAGGDIHKKPDWFGDNFRYTFDLNFTGVLNTLEFVIPQMNKQDYGHVAIISSVSGYNGLPYLNPAYTTAKAALIHLGQSLKWKLYKRNIRIQIVCPGYIDTPLNKDSKIVLPFIMSENKAIEKIYKGLMRGGFEIAFPRLTTVLGLKALNLLPYFLYFRVVDFCCKFSFAFKSGSR
jgi:NAD(P)-dependent dehydrogenase (short-subunit alcohol dehydrogenase family)